MINRYSRETYLRGRYQIREYRVIGKSFFTVQYRYIKFIFIRGWVDVMVHDTLEEAVNSIELIISLKLSDY